MPFIFKQFLSQVLVNNETFDWMETQWASPGDVFQLVPSIFQDQVLDHYCSLGSPVISSNNIWTIYTSLLEKFESIPSSIAMAQVFELQKNIDPMACNLKVPLLPNLAPLHNNQYFLHGNQLAPSDSEGPSMGTEFHEPHWVFVDFSDNDNCNDNDGAC